MRSLRLLARALMVVLGVGCTDVTSPSLSGLPFVTAVVEGVPWAVVDTAGAVAGQLTPDSSLVVTGVPNVTADTLRILGFQVGHFHGVGTYSLMETSAPGPVTAGYYEVHSGPSLSDVEAFRTSGPYTGQVRVTAVDTRAHIIAGTFAFTAVQVGGSAIVHVTNGSFRIRA